MFCVQKQRRSILVRRLASVELTFVTGVFSSNYAWKYTPAHSIVNLTGSVVFGIRRRHFVVRILPPPRVWPTHDERFDGRIKAFWWRGTNRAATSPMRQWFFAVHPDAKYAAVDHRLPLCVTATTSPWSYIRHTKSHCLSFVCTSAILQVDLCLYIDVFYDLYQGLGNGGLSTPYISPYPIYITLRSVQNGASWTVYFLWRHHSKPLARRRFHKPCRLTVRVLERITLYDSRLFTVALHSDIVVVSWCPRRRNGQANHFRAPADVRYIRHPSMSSRAFSAAGATAWKCLSSDIMSSLSFPVFCRRKKGLPSSFFFSCHPFSL